MDKNNKGRLFSLDICVLYSRNLNRRFISKIAPLVHHHTRSKKLKSRWTFIKGNAQVILPSVLKMASIPKIFMALQGHTYDVQKNESDASWHLLKSGSIFVLDRPDWNKGKFLKEFLKEHGDEVQYHQTFKEGRIDDPFEFTVIIKK